MVFFTAILWALEVSLSVTALVGAVMLFWRHGVGRCNTLDRFRYRSFSTGDHDTLNRCSRVRARAAVVRSSSNSRRRPQTGSSGFSVLQRSLCSVAREISQSRNASADGNCYHGLNGWFPGFNRHGPFHRMHGSPDWQHSHRQEVPRTSLLLVLRDLAGVPGLTRWMAVGVPAALLMILPA